MTARLSLTLFGLLAGASLLFAQRATPTTTSTAPATFPATLPAPAPTRVTLKFTDAPAADVIAALQPQLPFKLQVDVDLVKNVKVSIDVADEPFWAVMGKLSPLWPLRVAPHDMGGDRLLLGDKGSDYFTPRVAQLGAMTITPTGVHSTVHVDYAEPSPTTAPAAGPAAPANVRAGVVTPGRDRTNRVQVQLAVLIEPHLRPLGLNLVGVEAFDEKGQALTFPQPPGNSPARPSRNQPNQSGLQLILPGDGSSREIARLRGMVRYKTALRMEKIEVPSLAAEKDQPMIVSGRKFIVRVAEPTEVGVVVRLLQPVQGTANANDETMQQLQSNLICLDAKGAPLTRQIQGLRVTDGKNFEHVINFTRTKGVGEPAKLYWDLPADIRDVLVPFELRNIPLTD